MATMIPSDIGEFETEEMIGVLQSSISKKIMVDIIPFGVIHKRVGPIVWSLSYRVHWVIELQTSKQGSHF